MAKKRLSEKQIQNLILKYLATQKCLYWRQNSGNFSVKAKEVLSKIMRILKINPAIASRITGMFYKQIGHYDCTSIKGLPDIMVIKDGVLIGIEVKTATGKQRESQKYIEEQFKKNGAKYFIVRSLEEVVDIFKEEKWKN